MLNSVNEVGYISGVFDSVISVRGLPGATILEQISFDNGGLGFVLNLMEDHLNVLMLSSHKVNVGDIARRLGRRVEIPVFNEFFGQVIDPLISNSSFPLTGFREVDVPPKPLSFRKKITEPFLTGVSVVDLLMPLGKGQRQLVIGDQKTGKSEFLYQTMLNQAKLGTYVIYTAVGKRMEELKRLEGFISKNNIQDKCLIMSSFAGDSQGLIYITPFSSMTLAEYLAEKGNDVLLIIDDMTVHAKAYRELSLMAKKFPGRASYPGDTFYTHARLLERAGSFLFSDNISGSITCLIAVDTVEGDISGYIPTNLMSITDGHIFFDKELFDEGTRPAINQFFSVTRVGRQTQSILRWGINRELRSFFTLLRDTERFAHFGAELNQGILATISMGEKLSKFFNQPMGFVVPINVQILVFCLIWTGATGPIEENDPATFLLTACSIYDTDKNFRYKIDALISSCTTFNDLLAKISLKSKDLVREVKG